MKDPIRNLISKAFWSIIPLGFVVWWFNKHGRSDDTLGGKSGWYRVYSSYKSPIGAVVLIRNMSQSDVIKKIV
jgi:hypothetical protein